METTEASATMETMEPLDTMTIAEAAQTTETLLLEIRGHTIAVRGYNLDLPGAPIVFIHGILLSINFWEPVLPEAVRRHQPFIVLSLPGHFPSRFPASCNSDEVTDELFAELHAEAIRRTVGNRPVRLVGWSTGGFSALNLAARSPELVERVMCIAGFSRGVWLRAVLLLREGSRLSALGLGLFRMALPWVTGSPRLFRWFMRHGAAKRQAFARYHGIDELLETLRADAHQHDPRTMATLFERIPGFDLAPLLDRITAPAWIVGGTDDPFVPFAEARYLAGQIPGARLIEFEGGGHMFFAENTAQWHETLEAFLEE